MSLSQRQSRNANSRANGNEPEPGSFAGVKRWMRYHKRVTARYVEIKNPDKHLHSHARGWVAYKRTIDAARA
jgi:hypothetical protein